MMTRTTVSRGVALAAAGVLLAAVSACGTSSSAPSAGPASAAGSAPSGAAPAGAAPVESNPPGDIPDNVAYVTAADPQRGFLFRHPEGWAEAAVPGGVRFTDKLNSVTVTATAGPAPSVDSVRNQLVPTLNRPSAAFQLGSVSTATLPAGPAVKVLYRQNSDPDPVTGRVYRDEVVTYLVGVSGKVLRMDLSGPVGADNVDPYKTMSDSLAAA